jgi:hypothetical protein
MLASYKIDLLTRRVRCDRRARIAIHRCSLRRASSHFRFFEWESGEAVRSRRQRNLLRFEDAVKTARR